MKFFNLKFLNLIFFLLSICYLSNNVLAFPIYAQQAYENPREANGRIACANCHLAQKPVEIEVPQAILPNSLFKAVVKIPYDLDKKQILANGLKGNLNVGAVVILPEGFKLATQNQMPKTIQEKNKGIYISAYSPTAENILVVGPIAGNTHQDIIFPIVSPDPSKNKEVNFLKYPIYVGANRGRGQITPTGDKTNNNIILASSSGEIINIIETESKGWNIFIKTIENNTVTQFIPKGLELIVSKGLNVSMDQPLTKDPNVGGFGQIETEIVLQSSTRIYGYIILCFFITLTQIFLVIKKKQFEKVQAFEINF